MQRTNWGLVLDEYAKDRMRLTQTEMPRVTRSFQAPKIIDPRPWLQIENQGSMGSCQGHALSTVLEYIHYAQTGKVIQLSRLFAYYATQQIDGLLGRDAGSTIDGGRRLAQTKGVCLESVMPYPNPVRYTGQFTPAAMQEALKFRIKSHTVLESGRAVYDYLALGYGAVEIGIPWGGLVIRDGIVIDFRGGGGGHALAFVGYLDQLGPDGMPLVIMANSWGKNWEQAGFVLVTQSAITKMAQHRYTVMIGMSDMFNLKPREVLWTGPKDLIWQ